MELGKSMRRAAYKVAKKAEKEVKALAGDEGAQKLKRWQDWLKDARSDFQPQLDMMDRREDLYDGCRTIQPGPSARKGVAREATTVINYTAELIESEVDSSFPYPKVTPKHGWNEANARMIEAMLRSDIDRLPFEELNDEQERTCPIQGGSWFYVEWDNTLRTRTTMGDTTVQLLHPKQVFPQAGVKNIHRGKRCFIQLSVTKEYVKERYGVDVYDETESNPEIDVASSTGGASPAKTDSKVTLNIGFEKNRDGGVARFAWVNDTVVEDLEDYQVRIIDVCAKCGLEKPFDREECLCGSKKWKRKAQTTERLLSDVTLPGGAVIPAGTEIPYYRPDVFPLVLRKNVSKYGKLLGDSDVDKIADLQYRVNKLSTKEDEKLLKGGSVLTLPERLSIRTDDSEFKVVKVKSPQDVEMIQVRTLQPNVSYDVSEIMNSYMTMKSILGVSDSFQGKPDKTATSGVAKQIAAARSAGRLESKARMKDAAYANLYRLLFKLKLAYADEPRPTAMKNGRGRMEYGEFSRYDFLEQDASGAWYYNDEYTFAVDSTGSMAANREALWQETRMNYQQGAFGPVGQPESLALFWLLMEKLHYPMATEIREQAEEQLQQKKQMEQMQMQQQVGPAAGPMMGGPMASGPMQAGPMMGGPMAGGMPMGGSSEGA